MVEKINLEKEKMAGLEGGLAQEGGNDAIQVSPAELVDLDRSLDSAKVCLEGRSFEKLEGIYRVGKTELAELEAKRQQREKQFEQNPFADLKVSDYDRLVREKLIDDDFAEKLKSMELVIGQLRAVQYPTTSAKLQLERLLERQRKFYLKIDEAIKAKQEAVALEQAGIREKELASLNARISRLEETIKEIESDPNFLKKLAERKKQIEKIYQAEKKRERERVIEAAKKYADSIAARHAVAFARIGEVVGDKGIKEKMIEALQFSDRREMISFFDQLRTKLIRSITMGFGEKQIKELSEVVPWRMVDGIHYRDAQIFLKEFVAGSDSLVDDEALKKLSNGLLAENLVLYKVFGAPKYFDKREQKEKSGQFWAAFDKRKEDDEKGITENLREQQEKSAEINAVVEKEIGEIVKKGGFVIEAPIYGQVPGKKEAMVVVGTKRGAVLLEKEKSKKGQEVWKVTGLAGATNGLKIGSVSSLDMRAFPGYVRDAAKYAFAKRGDDFVERLTYEE